ncbi:MAG: putative Kef-type K+ transport protein [Pseudohongiellaceae bacterium]|jgi:predicted Kef-type K+ transport protein
MDFIWILIAFCGGFLVKQLGLPPMVGYLLAGFGLHALGFEPHESLDSLANVGITLMLFTIGLKLNIRTLIKPEVCVTAVSHSVFWCLFILGKWLLLSALGFGLTSMLDMSWQSALLIALALSFSSTVGVIKLLEDQDELKTRHGKVAIGVLVIQDIIAVLFLTIATGKVPSIWALSLFLLIPMRPLLNNFMEKGGHGELLPLAGFFFAMGGSELFTLVNLKGDLGALVMGALIGAYPKSTELYKSLISFKDLFLIGFFLLIGFTALPTLEMLAMAALITVLLVAKFGLFLALFFAVKMRPRNAFLCAITLSNFSEFGLIVANMSVENGWLDADWLVIIALAVTFSFVISGGIFKHSHKIYARYKDLINRLQWREDANRLIINQPKAAEIFVVGLGRVGTSTYDSLSVTFPGKVLGIDADEERVSNHQQLGREVILSDGEDADFWSQVNLSSISLIMLSTPNISEMQSMIEQIRNSNFSGRIVCISRFEDDRQQLLEVGADAVFSYFAEVGAGFAEEGKKLLKLT